MCAILVQATSYLMVLFTTVSLLFSGSDHHTKTIKFILTVKFDIFTLTKITSALKLEFQHMQAWDPH